MLDDAGPHPVVEHHAAVLEAILEVHVHRGRPEPRRQFRQRQIVRGHEPDGAGLDEGAHDRFRADAPVVRIGAVQDFVEQEQQRRRSARRLDDRADAQNLAVEPRLSRLE